MDDIAAANGAPVSGLLVLLLLLLPLLAPALVAEPTPAPNTKRAFAAGAVTGTAAGCGLTATSGVACAPAVAVGCVPGPFAARCS